MSARSTLSIDTFTIKLATQLIDEMEASEGIVCFFCERKSDLSCCILNHYHSVSNQIESMLVCRGCIEKVAKSVKIVHLTTLSAVYSLMQTFNQFDIEQLSQVLVDKVLKALSEVQSWRRDFQRELVSFMSQEMLATPSKFTRDNFPSNGQKCQFVLLVCSYFIERLKRQQELHQLFNRQGWLQECISQQGLSFFVRLMRNQIQIKLETLKTLLLIVSLYREPCNIQYFCEEAMFLLESPLKSFYKAEEYSKNVVYSIDRREVQLKSFEESELTVEQYLQLQETVRLNLPLRNKPVVFRIKCVSRPQYVRLGFFFMKNEDYLNQGEYLKPFEPFQIVFEVYPNKNHSEKEYSQDYTPELLRPQVQHFNIPKAEKNQKKDNKIVPNGAIPEQKRQKLLAINWRKNVKNIDTQRRRIEDGHLIELRYDSNSLSMRNLSIDSEPYRWKLNRKSSAELKNMVIFACVTLTGPDCSVEYVSWEKES